MRIIPFFVLVICLAISNARPPLESYKRYMFVMVHGVGGCTVPDGWSHQIEWAPGPCGGSDSVPVKSVLWDEGYDDRVPTTDPHDWMGNIGNTLMKQGFIGHAVWYDFRYPWMNPIYQDDATHKTALSQSLGRRYETGNTNWVGNPMGDPTAKMGLTAQSFWLRTLTENIKNKNSDPYGIGFPGAPALPDSSDLVQYSGFTGPYLNLAKKDFGTWYRYLNKEKTDVPAAEVPRKYILIGHSMGGLTSRDYLTGQFYQGDVDKLITLDSPHEGAAIANYVDMWSKADRTASETVVGFSAMTGVVAAAMLSTSGEPWTAVLLGLSIGVTATELLPAIQKAVQNMTEGYGVENHFGNAIQDMSLGGISSRKMNPALQQLADRATIKDENKNGYQVPFFDLVSTSGVPTPGGCGDHKASGYGDNGPYSWLTGICGTMFKNPDLYGYGELADPADMIYRMAVGFGTSSIWNDWGSGFVANWSGRGDRVKLFNLPDANTERMNIRYDGDVLLPDAAAIYLSLTILEGSLQVAEYLSSGKTNWYLRIPAYGAVGLGLYIVTPKLSEQLLKYVGFHGRMAYRVDNDLAENKPESGYGSDERVIDQLLWEKPSISLIFRPTDQEEYAKQAGPSGYKGGGSISIGATGASVAITAKGTIQSYWALNPDKTLYTWKRTKEMSDSANLMIRGVTKDTRIFSFQILDKNGIPLGLEKDLSTCTLLDGFVADVPHNKSGTEVTPFMASGAGKGLAICDIHDWLPTLLIKEGDEFGIQISGYDPSGKGEVLVDINQEPGWAYIPKLLDVASGSDWDEFITVKARRFQRWNPEDKKTTSGAPDWMLNPDVADMVDYYRPSLLVVNKIPRVLEFEVDDLQPDRLISLGIDLNFRSVQIKYEAKSDPNLYRTVATQDSKYTLTVTALGFPTKVVEVNNPVDQWGRFRLDLDQIATLLGNKFQPFLEGRNHMKIMLKNRWQMSAAQNLDLYIPGAPPFLEPLFPMPFVRVKGKAAADFNVDLIYGVCDPLINGQIKLTWIDPDGVEHIYPSTGLTVVQASSSATITRYHVTSGPIDWGMGTDGSGSNGFHITITPTIKGMASVPLNYQYEVVLDDKTPTLTIDYPHIDTYNPSQLQFEGYDEVSSAKGAFHYGLKDVWADLYSKDGKTFKANAGFINFAIPGNRAMPINVGALADGEYQLKLRSHDNSYQSREAYEGQEALLAEIINGSSWLNMRDTKAFGAEGMVGPCATTGCMTNWSVPQSMMFILTHSVSIKTATIAGSVTKITRKYVERTAQGVPVEMVGDGLAVRGDWNSCYLTSTAYHAPNAVIYGERHTQNSGTVTLRGKTGSWSSTVALTATATDPCGTLKGILIPKPEAVTDGWAKLSLPPDGDYFADFTFMDGAGNSKTVTKSVTIDLQPIQIEPLGLLYRLPASGTQKGTFRTDAIPALVTATQDCNNAVLTMTKLSTDQNGTTYQFEGPVQSTDGRCNVVVLAKDGLDADANETRIEMPFLIGKNPPEILSPSSSAIVQGLVEIRGVAERPSFESAQFVSYSLDYAPIVNQLDAAGNVIPDAQGFPTKVVGTYVTTGLQVPLGTERIGKSNSSSVEVLRDGNVPGILASWNTASLTPGAYFLRLTTEDTKGTAQHIILLYVSPSSSLLALNFVGLPSSHQFATGNLPIRWSVQGFPYGRNLDTHLEAVHLDAAGNPLSRPFATEWIQPDVSSWIQEPTAALDGVQTWLKTNTTTGQSWYHLRFTAGSKETRYRLTVTQATGAGLEIGGATDGSLAPDWMSVSPFGVLCDVTVPAGTSKEGSFFLKGDVPGRIDLAIGTREEGTNAAVPLWDPTNASSGFFYAGAAVLPTLAAAVELPASRVGLVYVWDGTRNGKTDVPDGPYLLKMSVVDRETREMVETSAKINLVGRPVKITEATILPDEGFLFSEQLAGKASDISVKFNLNKDAFVTVEVREKGANPSLDLYLPAPNICPNGELKDCLLAGRTAPWIFNWDGNYQKNLRITPSTKGYEVIIRAYKNAGDASPADSKTLDLNVKTNGMTLADDMEVSVEEATGTTLALNGLTYQRLAGLTDYVVKAVADGTRVTNEAVNIQMRYNGTQLASKVNFDRFSFGVQLHKSSIDLWAVSMAVFLVRREEKVTCHDEDKIRLRAAYKAITLNESQVGQPLNIDFEYSAGDRSSSLEGTAHMKRMDGAFSQMILIPRSAMTESFLINAIAGIDADGDDVGTVKDGRFGNWLKLRNVYSVATFRWGPGDDEFIPTDITNVNNDTYTISTNMLRSAFAEDYVDGSNDAVPEDTDPEALNEWFNDQLGYDPDTKAPSSSKQMGNQVITWNASCDVGGASKCSSSALDPSDPRVGNHVPDDGEPLLGDGSLRYHKEKPALNDELTVQAYMWRRHWWNPNGCLGAAHKHIRIRYQITATPKFWGTATDSYGWNNLVNGYFTLDPENEFAFGANGVWPKSVPRYVAPGYPLTFSLLDATGAGPLSLLNAQAFHYDEAGSGFIYPILGNSILAQNVSVIFHDKGSTAAFNQNARILFTLHYSFDDETVNRTQEFTSSPGTIYSPITIGSTLAMKEVTIPGLSQKVLVPDQFAHRLNMFKVSVSIPGVPLIADISKTNRSLPWPIGLARLNALMTEGCNAVGVQNCGHDQNADVAYTGLGMDKVGDAGFVGDYRVLDVKGSMGRLPGLPCCGFDLGNYRYRSGSLFAETQNGIGLKMDTKASIATITTADAFVLDGTGAIRPEFYLQGDILKKRNEEKGAPYEAAKDPLFAYDKDGDGKINEDAWMGSNSVGTDDDLDLNRDEDPEGTMVASANGSFPFVGSNAQKPFHMSTMLDLLKSMPYSDNPKQYKGYSLITNLGDNPDMVSTWIGGSARQPQLYYKDGLPNLDLDLYRSGMDNDNLAMNQINVFPLYHANGERRLARVHAKLPTLGNVSLYVSGKEGWTKLTTRTLSQAVGSPFDGQLAFWEVNSSGPQQILMVRNYQDELRYAVSNIAVFGDNSSVTQGKTSVSDALGQAQLTIANQAVDVDISTISPDDAAWNLPPDNMLGPVVKLSPMPDLSAGDATLSLRIACKTIKSVSSFKVTVVADGGWSTPLAATTWLFYDPQGNLKPNAASCPDDGYALVTGTIPAQPVAINTATQSVLSNSDLMPVNVNGKPHSMQSTVVDNTSADVTLNSVPQTRRLRVGEAAYFDLDADGKPDFRVTLAAIMDGKTKLIHEVLSEQTALAKVAGYFVTQADQMTGVTPIVLQPHATQVASSNIDLQGLRDGRYAVEVLVGATDNISQATIVPTTVQTEQAFETSVTLLMGANHIFVRYVGKVVAPIEHIVVERVALHESDLVFALDPYGAELLTQSAVRADAGVAGQVQVHELTGNDQKTYVPESLNSNAPAVLLLGHLQAQQGLVREFSADFTDVAGNSLGRAVLRMPVDLQNPRMRVLDAMRYQASDSLGVRFVWAVLTDARTGIEVARKYLDLGSAGTHLLDWTWSRTGSTLQWAITSGSATLGSLSWNLPANLADGAHYQLTCGVTDVGGNRSSSFVRDVNDFPEHRNLFVDLVEAGVGSDLKDFPLLLRLNAGNFDFATARADGADLRILDAQGAVLRYEIERFDPYTRMAEIWVRIPSIPAGAQSVSLDLRWGNPNAVAALNPSLAWASEYHGVYHFGEPHRGLAQHIPAYGNRAVHVTGKLTLGDRVQVLGEVGAGSLLVGFDAMLRNNVLVQGDVKLANRALVQGNVQAGGALVVDAVSDAGKVQGTVLTNKAPELFALEALPSMVVGANSVEVGNDGTKTLAPGNYRNLVVGDRVRLNLQGGVYTFATFDVTNDVVLNVDLSQGPVTLNIRDRMVLGARFVVNLTGGGDASWVRWNLAQEGAVAVIEEAKFQGIFFAPNAKVSVRRGSFTGALWAAEADFDNQVVLTHVPLTPHLAFGGSAVPPGTLLDASQFVRNGTFADASPLLGPIASGLDFGSMATSKATLPVTLDPRDQGQSVSFWLRGTVAAGELVRCGGLVFAVNQGMLAVDGLSTALTEGWHHFAYTLNQNGRVLYKDGASVSTSAGHALYDSYQTCVVSGGNAAVAVDELEFAVRKWSADDVKLAWFVQNPSGGLTVAPNPPTIAAPTMHDRNTGELILQDATGYVTSWQVERLNADGSWTLVGTLQGASTTFQATNLACGQEYLYRVRAGKDPLWSDYSKTLSLVTDRCALSADYLAVNLMVLDASNKPLNSADVAVRFEASADASFAKGVIAESYRLPVRNGLLQFAAGQKVALDGLLTQNGKVYARIFVDNTLRETYLLTAGGIAPAQGGRLAGAGAPPADLEARQGSLYLDITSQTLYIKFGPAVTDWKAVGKASTQGVTP